jgi:hypothetical protein
MKLIWDLSLMFPHQNPVHSFPLPIQSYMPAQLIFLDFITRTIVGEEYRPWSSSKILNLKIEILI